VTPTQPASAADGVRPGARVDRLTRPRARDIVTEAAIEAGVCIRRVLLRWVDTTSGSRSPH
jgi:hypothetical protein